MYATLIPMTRNEQVARDAVRTRVRDELAWTNRQLAEKAGVNYDTVNDFLNRNLWPRADSRGKIEQAIGWPEGRIEEVATIGAALHRSGESPTVDGTEPSVVLDFPPGALDGMTEAQIEEVIAAAKASALQRAREIKRDS